MTDEFTRAQLEGWAKFGIPYAGGTALAAYALKQMERAEVAEGREELSATELTAARKVVEAARKAVDDWQLDWDSKAYGMMVTTLRDYDRATKGEQG